MAFPGWCCIWWVNLPNICSDNGLSPGRRQAIIWTNAGILLIRTLGTNFSEIVSGINTFSFKKMCFKMSSAKCPFCLCLNVFNWHDYKSSNELVTDSMCVILGSQPALEKQYVLVSTAEYNKWIFFAMYWFRSDSSYMIIFKVKPWKSRVKVIGGASLGNHHPVDFLYPFCLTSIGPFIPEIWWF